MGVDIPLCDLIQQYLALKDEIDAAMVDVARRGQYILGPNVRALEREVADYCGCQYAVGVNSGTDALLLSLMALGLGPGDEVITTPFTFIATSEAIRLTGAMPVFVDIDPQTYNLDAGLLEAAITERTKAILPVHLYGQPCDMDAILAIAEDRGLAVVEDCAQAIGATYKDRRVGSLGTTGCFSFFPSKNLGCFGDGGMVVTDDEAVFERIEMLRRHGGRVKYHHEVTGVNSRLDELQAAVLRVKFQYLDSWNALRREHAATYNRLLGDLCRDVQIPAELQSDSQLVPLEAAQSSSSRIDPVYHQYTIATMSPTRDGLVAGLKKAGIGCAVYYPVPLHLQAVNADLQGKIGDFPRAEHAAERCLSLPMFPELKAAQQEAVVAKLKELCSEHALAELAA